MTVFSGSERRSSPRPITANDGMTFAVAIIARLKKKAHHVMVRPGTRPSNTASHASVATPAPGAMRPVAMRSGSTTHCRPRLHGIGRSAAIWVPMPRYRSVAQLDEWTGFIAQPRTTAPPPATMTPTMYSLADRDRDRKGVKTVEF